ncbi:MFS transporter [Planomonospora sphaerica]|uniref:MFS transporter n=1 Tax=Planomonospora sphaerica TaxID=161355 RepID=A0A171DPN9_9ACTN|nr:hypothetical protein [Planomonospora sphaerica]GAT71018.1 MFS transporter [Planomonospora sphaerica]
MFAHRAVSGALGVFLLAATALGGVYLLITQYLQLAKGLSPLQAGLWVLPAAALLVLVSTASPIAVRRIRPGRLIAAGLAVQLVVGSVPPQKAGAASGLATTCSDLGISLGIAVIGSIATAVYRGQVTGELPGGLPPEAAAASRDSLGGAVTAAQALPGELAAAVLAPARTAFASGLTTEAVIAAVIAAAAAVPALRRLGHIPPTGSTPGR